MRSADILGRCASTTTLSRPRASTFGSVSGVVTGLRVEVRQRYALRSKIGFGGAAFQEIVAVNGGRSS